MDYHNYQENTGICEESYGTAAIPGLDDDRKLFIGGLGRSITGKDLKEYFIQFGEIESITIKTDVFTGQSRGFAFIVFTNSETLGQVLDAGDHYIKKRKVDAKKVAKKLKEGKIFVGGLTPEISDTDIKDYFAQYGTIVDMKTPFDKTKNQRKGYCFITFESSDVADVLLKTPKQYICGKIIDVAKAIINPLTMGEAGREGAWQGGYGRGGACLAGQGRGRGGYGGGEYSQGYGYGTAFEDYVETYNLYDGAGTSQRAYGTGSKTMGAKRYYPRHYPY